MAYLTPEKEVDLMLEFSRIKTELIDLGENESDYPTLSIAEVKQIEKYKQVRVAVANVLDLHKGKAFHPKNAINEPYIENVDPHLTEERLEQIINYAANISTIVKGVLESGGQKLKKDHMKWLQTFYEKAWSAENNAPVRAYNKEIIEDMKHLHCEEAPPNMLKENIVTPELETHNQGADVAVRQGLYGTELPEGDIDLKQFRLFHTMDTYYSWHNGLPQPVLQAIANGILCVIDGDIKVSTCKYTKCDNLIRLLSRGGSTRQFCSPLHRNYQFREVKKFEKKKPATPEKPLALHHIT